MRDQVMNLAAAAVDTIWNLKKYQAPTTVPAPQIIAHRGAWDRWRVENTMPAFEEAKRLGAWGIEFDVHFSRDGVPIVNHDADLLRCHKQDGVVCDMKFSEIRKLAPDVPTLEEVLELKGLHFFIEIKTFLNAEQVSTLNSLLGRLNPTIDFHLLALDDQLVRAKGNLPSWAWVLVGELALTSMVEASLERRLGGVAGHFLGMTTSLCDRLHQNGQKAGVGFVPTTNLFKREWSRGIDWVFTNSMAALQNARSDSY